MRSPSRSGGPEFAKTRNNTILNVETAVSRPTIHLYPVFSRQVSSNTIGNASLDLRVDQSFSTPIEGISMITIIKAHLECYASDDFGIIYQFSDGGIGGRSIGSFDEAVQEVKRINGRTSWSAESGTSCSGENE